MGREEGGLEAVPEADTVGATGAPCLQSPGRAACGVLTWLGPRLGEFSTLWGLGCWARDSGLSLEGGGALGTTGGL